MELQLVAIPFLRSSLFLIFLMFNLIYQNYVRRHKAFLWKKNNQSVLSTNGKGWEKKYREQCWIGDWSPLAAKKPVWASTKWPAQPCPGLQHFSYIIRNTLYPKKSNGFFIFNKTKSFFVLFQPLECSFNPRVGTNGQVLGGAHQWFVRGRNGAGHHKRPPKRRIPSWELERILPKAQRTQA